MRRREPGKENRVRAKCCSITCHYNEPTISSSLSLSLTSECVFNQDIKFMCGGAVKKQIQYEVYMIIDFEKKKRVCMRDNPFVI